MLRALMRSIFGRNAGCGFCSMRVHRTPRLPRSMASVRPVGPAPTIKTSLSIAPHGQAMRQSIPWRQGAAELLERLIGRIAALFRSSIDKLGKHPREINRDFGLELTVTTKLHANHVMLTVADRLEHRWGDQRAAEVGAGGQRLPEKLHDLSAVVGRGNVRIDRAA